MRLNLLLSLFFFLVVLVSQSPRCSGAQDPYGEFVAKSDPKTPEEERKCFHLPPGFAIELVAAEPDIRKPINMNFDDRGRLWVTQSVEYPFPAPRDRKARDVIKILDNTHRDGKADKVTTFADGLSIPIGVLPFQDGALVYSIPNIYHVWASNGSDHADKREVAYSQFGFADTHGMASSFTWGFDGWIYACHGFSNTSTIKGKDGVAVTMNSGNTYRIRPDGSHIEQFTHGQVNPFGLCFDPLGNLYSADCHTKPVMMLLRGGYYQSFGKPDDGLGFAPEMCDHDHGSTALCGIVYYAAANFPPDFQDNIFIGNVVTNRINRDKLERHGSTYKAIQQPDFLSCDDPWFRPVDLKLGPDGALYVADFYNRIIGHYEVPLTHPGRDRERGRIWRIFSKVPKSGTPLAAHFDWTRASMKELAAQLANSNLTVRMKAASQLVERGGADAISVVRQNMVPVSHPYQRMHGLWVLERLNALDDEILDAAIKDADNGVRVHAMKVLAERKDLSHRQKEWIFKALTDMDGFVTRAAADALSTHPSPENLEPLLAARHSVPGDDTHLLYMVRMALRNQLRDAHTWEKLEKKTWNDKDHQALADVAAGFADQRAAAFLFAYLQRFTDEQQHLHRFLHHIGRYGDPTAVRTVIVMAMEAHHTPDRDKAAMFKEVYEGTHERGAKMTNAERRFAYMLARRLLPAREAPDVLAGIDVVSRAKLSEFQPRLVALAEKKSSPEEVRRAALDSIASMNPRLATSVIERILTDGTEEITLRERVAETLAGINRPEARQALLRNLIVAPARLQNVIAAGLALNPDGAKELLDAVTAGKASERLIWEWSVNIRLIKHPDIKDRLAKLTSGPSPADKRLQDLLQHRRVGFIAKKSDAVLGLKVFEKSCATCHQVAGKGAKIGPQLDGIGIRGIDRLLEDIIDPNRNVDQAFRSTLLTLKNGQIVTGLLLREEGQVYVIADSQGKEVRVAKGDTEERTVSQLSPMPANLVDQIPEADFYDLMAYLLSLRPLEQQKMQ
jgi:putative heme-binding domain-containing protein